MDSVNYEDKFDVIIVGAGLSGLSAAKKLRESGANILVLEANNRVGGRTFTVKNPNVNYVDYGGSYIGGTQHHLLALSKELGIETYVIDEQLPSIYFSKTTGRQIYSKAGRPKFGNPIVQMDVNHLFRTLDNLMKDVPSDSPWNAPRAKELDEMTVRIFGEKYLWTKAAKNILETLCEAFTGSSAYESSFLWFLWYAKLSNATRRIFFSTGGAPEEKFIGGSQMVSERIAKKFGKHVLLNKPVCEIIQNRNNIIVSTLDGSEFEADYVILAIPLSLHMKIHFSPTLPPIRHQLIQKSPMGCTFKVHVYYEKPFWRSKGLCGASLVVGADDEEHPVCYTMDDTKSDGSFPAITGFIVGDNARKMCRFTKDERRDIITRSFAKIFDSAEALEATHYEEYNWMENQYSGGGYCVMFPPGCLTMYGREIREPVGKLHFAGTETATLWIGYMEGAIIAGNRAAEEVLRALGLISEMDALLEDSKNKEIPVQTLTFWERHSPSVGGFYKLLGFSFAFVTILTMGNFQHKYQFPIRITQLGNPLEHFKAVTSYFQNLGHKFL